MKTISIQSYDIMEETLVDRNIHKEGDFALRAAEAGKYIPGILKDDLLIFKLQEKVNEDGRYITRDEKNKQVTRGLIYKEILPRTEKVFARYLGIVRTLATK